MNPRFGKEPRRAVTGLCPHGRPDGAYCKRCAASAEASGVAVADAPVTLPERVAGRVLELWNEHVCDLGRGYEPFPDSYLPIIARRCAERPDVGEGMHAAIVDAFFDGTWWDRPLPDFVYGSTLQFDRALDKARGTLAAAARGKLRPLEPVPEPQPREERSAIVAGILESLADEIAAARRSA